MYSNNTPSSAQNYMGTIGTPSSRRDGNGAGTPQIT